MTSEEANQVRKLIRTAPRSIWGYWPFVFPVLVVIVGIAINIGLVIHFQRKAPDLQVLFKVGKRVEPVWDSQLVQEAVMIATLSVTVTFGLLASLARIAYRQVRLLRAAAEDLGIEDGPERTH